MYNPHSQCKTIADSDHPLSGNMSVRKRALAMLFTSSNSLGGKTGVVYSDEGIALILEKAGLVTVSRDALGMYTTVTDKGTSFVYYVLGLPMPVKIEKYEMPKYI